MGFTQKPREHRWFYSLCRNDTIDPADGTIDRPIISSLSSDGNVAHWQCRWSIFNQHNVEKMWHLMGKEATTLPTRKTWDCATDPWVFEDKWQRCGINQLHVMPSPSGKSWWVQDQGLPPHLVTQVSRCSAWPHDGVQGELKWTTPFSGGLGVSGGSADMNICGREATSALWKQR